MRYLRDPYRRRIVEVATAGVAAALALVAFMVHRREASTALLAGGGLVLFVEFIYSMNLWTGRLFGRLRSSGWYRGNQLVGAVIFWLLAAGLMIDGVYMLVKP